MIDGGQDGRIKGFRQEEAPKSYCIGLPRVKRLLHRNLARSYGGRHHQQVRQRNSCDPILFPYLSTGSLCRKIPPPWVSPVATCVKQGENVCESDSYDSTNFGDDLAPGRDDASGRPNFNDQVVHDFWLEVVYFGRQVIPMRQPVSVPRGLFVDLAYRGPKPS
jgi:hypothetical protein